MIIEQKEKYTLITSKENDFNSFIKSFESLNDKIHEKSLILQLSESLNIKIDNIFVFLKCAEAHQKSGTSFVVIKKDVDVDLFPEWFNIVPSVVEAEDVLQMEEIQRDLGF